MASLLMVLALKARRTRSAVSNPPLVYFAETHTCSPKTQDTREDYILLSPSLKWSVDLKGYDLKVKPRGLTSCHHMVSVHLLPPPSNNTELENARRLPAQAPISDLSRREFQKVDGGRMVVFPGLTKEVSQASLSSSLSDLNHKLTTSRRDSRCASQEARPKNQLVKPRHMTAYIAWLRVKTPVKKSSTPDRDYRIAHRLRVRHLPRPPCCTRCSRSASIA